MKTACNLMSLQTRDRLLIQASVIPTASNSVDTPQLKSTGARRLPAILAYISAIEFLIVAISAYLGSTFYHYSLFGTLPDLKQYSGAALFVAVTFTAISLGFRHFAVAERQQLYILLWNGVGAVVLSFVVFLATIFLLKISEEYSRGAFIFEIVSVSIAICIFRTFSLLWLRAAIASGVIESRRAILIGDMSCHSTIIDELKTGGIRVVNSIPLPFPCNIDINAVPSGDRAALALNKNFRNAVNLCRAMLPDDILILAKQNDLSFASDLAHSLSEIPCSIHIAPLDDIRFIARSHSVDLSGVLTLQVSKPPLSLADLVVKRALDIFVATTALIALSPLLLTTAIAIKLDSRGNILFRQKRHGYNNKVIEIFKFRTMTAVESNGLTFAPTTPNDARVTAVGRILRRTNIDELPQLFNVLLGDMSIVGPRPHATVHNQMFEDQILPFARRHNVKPGITGWAQVNGYRGAADTIDKMRRRVEYDLYYIDNWSFFFDLKIIMMTLFSRKAYVNAY
jgi:Undecaprenyl-phosphate glucose phosphotransferase